MPRRVSPALFLFFFFLFLFFPVFFSTSREEREGRRFCESEIGYVTSLRFYALVFFLRDLLPPKAVHSSAHACIIETYLRIICIRT